ncbi:hypothetical protein Anapl_12158 [Anas platyrhynchos]|uniref:Uncharacterized protein n=1 Tax=Anas platyrhynchos TaxID=8839 RepID=R0LQ70_ANAPL|nr:hypothetical protein Anapl_12158 [Anas platyrhynchos]
MAELLDVLLLVLSSSGAKLLRANLRASQALKGLAGFELESGLVAHSATRCLYQHFSTKGDVMLAVLRGGKVSCSWLSTHLSAPAVCRHSPCKTILQGGSEQELFEKAEGEGSACNRLTAPRRQDPKVCSERRLQPAEAAREVNQHQCMQGRPSVGITDLLLGHQQLLGSYWEPGVLRCAHGGCPRDECATRAFLHLQPLLAAWFVLCWHKAVLCCLWVLQKPWLEKPGGGRLAMCRDALSRGAEWERCLSSARTRCVTPGDLGGSVPTQELAAGAVRALPSLGQHRVKAAAEASQGLLVAVLALAFHRVGNEYGSQLCSGARSLQRAFNREGAQVVTSRNETAASTQGSSCQVHGPGDAWRQDFGEVLSTQSCQSPLPSSCYKWCSWAQPFQKQELSEEPPALQLLHSLPPLLLAWCSPGARSGAPLWSVPCEVWRWLGAEAGGISLGSLLSLEVALSGWAGTQTGDLMGQQQHEGVQVKPGGFGSLVALAGALCSPQSGRLGWSSFKSGVCSRLQQLTFGARSFCCLPKQQRLCLRALASCRAVPQPCTLCSAAIPTALQEQELPLELQHGACAWALTVRQCMGTCTHSVLALARREASKTRHQALAGSSARTHTALNGCFKGIRAEICGEISVTGAYSRGLEGMWDGDQERFASESRVALGVCRGERNAG